MQIACTMCDFKQSIYERKFSILCFRPSGNYKSQQTQKGAKKNESKDFENINITNMQIELFGSIHCCYNICSKKIGILEVISLFVYL